MRIFISWSGDKSRAVAEELKTWLPRVIQGLEPWVSSTDIAKGKRWGDEIAKELAECTFGIICLTADNLASPWIHFEAGALANQLPGAVDEGRVTPLLVDLDESLLVQPLSAFQATKAERPDLLKLVQDLNALTESPLAADLLEETFLVWWERLEARLGEIAASGRKVSLEKAPRKDAEVLEELVRIARSNDRVLRRLEKQRRATDSMQEYDARALHRLIGEQLAILDVDFLSIVSDPDGVTIGVEEIPDLSIAQAIADIGRVAGISVSFESESQRVVL